MRAFMKVHPTWLISVALMLMGLHGVAQADVLLPNQPTSAALAVPGSFGYGNTLSPVGPGSFLDGYSFTIPVADFNTAASTISFGSYFGINGLSAALFSGSGTSGTPLMAWSVSSPIGPYGELTSLSTLALNAGTYTLGIKGIVTGSAGGSYSGVLNLANSSPVPEPGTGLIFLLGIGMVAFQMKRKQGTAK